MDKMEVIILKLMLTQQGTVYKQRIYMKFLIC